MTIKRHPAAAPGCPVPAAGTAARIDESYDNDDAVYVLAAVVVPPPVELAAEAAMRALVYPGRDRFHFSKELTGRRLRGAEVLAELALPLVVAVRTGARPERARGQCWPVLLWELHGLVDRLVVDARTPKLDRRDAATIQASRPRCCGPITYDFVRNAADPLLWAADITASSTFQARCRHDERYLSALRAGGRLQIVDL